MLRYISIIIFVVLLNFGISNPQNLKIVNGVPAELGEFPFMAFLRSTTNRYFCGCTFINEEWLLTAAFCSTLIRPDDVVEVVYGVVDYSQEDANITKVRRFIVHEDYGPHSRYDNDVALVQLTVPVAFNRLVQPVKLPRSNEEVSIDASATLLGWGLIRDGPISSRGNLMKANVTTFSNKECGIALKTLVCAGSRTGRIGQCHCDTGGVLLLGDAQIGIILSTRKRCSQGPYMDILIKVSSYSDWIQSKIESAN